MMKKYLWGEKWCINGFSIQRGPLSWEEDVASREALEGLGMA